MLASIFGPNFHDVVTFTLTQTYNSHLEGKKENLFWTQIQVEHDPGTQIQVVPNSVLESGNNYQTLYGNSKKKKVMNQHTFLIH